MVRIQPSFVKSLNIDGDSKMSIKDWIEEILFFNPVSVVICRVGRFIKRVFRWIPILWKQEEWDFAYIYDLIEFKIKELRKSITEDTIHTDECIKEEIEQIDEVLGYLDKFQNWTKYIEIPEPPKDFQRFTPSDDGCSVLNFTEEEHEAYRKADEFETENFNLFWDKLKEYHTNWWV